MTDNQEKRIENSIENSTSGTTSSSSGDVTGGITGDPKNSQLTGDENRRDNVDETLRRYEETLLKEKVSQFEAILSIFKSGLHKRYLLAHTLPQLPEAYAPYHQIILTLVHFAVSGLDILGIDLDQEQKDEIINWIYSLQVDIGTDSEPTTQSNGKIPPGGFRGSELMPRGVGNLAVTYTALCCLRILGDDYSRVNRIGIFSLLTDAYHEDGSFQDVGRSFGRSESDVRFVYSACAICTLLGDWKVPNVEWDKVVHYLSLCRSYDGGFGHTPYAESHGGSTYCIISSLLLLNKLETIDNPEELKYWLLNRQKTGFQGRINKPADSCYSFWIGGTLRNLGMNQFIDSFMCSRFISECAAKRGGFGKDPTSNSDLLHTYMSISGLSILGHPDLREIYPPLGITKRAMGDLEVPVLPDTSTTMP